jgi:hypothetical protein
MNSKDVRALIQEPPTPAAGNNVLGAIRRLVAFGMAQTPPMLTSDPTLGVKRRKVPKTGGFIAWTDSDIAEFRACHPANSASPACDGFTSVHGSAASGCHSYGMAARFGRSSGRSAIQNRRAPPNPHPPRAASHPRRDAARRNMTFLVTDYGKPFTPAGFGNWFGERCREAGLRLNAHGLRKAAARRLVEAGCSVHEVMAITGHRTLSEVQRYTREVEQERMADAAVRRLK